MPGEQPSATKEDGSSFERIQGEMRETERTQAARERLMCANQLYFGAVWIVIDIYM